MIDSFGEALRQLRIGKGWSLTQLAVRTGWSRSNIHNVETGRRRPSAQFTTHMDQALGSGPILSTLLGLTEKDDNVKRRILLSGLGTAVGLGAVNSYTALADTIRLDLQEGAGVTEDWDAMINDYQRRLMTEPTKTFGDQLTVSMMSARHQLAKRPDDVEVLRASAHLGLLYGLWRGNRGDTGTCHSFLRTAELLAQRSGDPRTQAYVSARTAVGGPYQGFTLNATQRSIDQAFQLAGAKPSPGLLEAHAATVHLTALTGNLAGGRVAVERMRNTAAALPPVDGPTPAQRTASFAAYLEGKLGRLDSAQAAMVEANRLLAGLPLWHCEAQLYYALALIRHGNPAEGVATALRAARNLRYPVRVVRLGVDDVLRALPANYATDEVVELRRHTATGGAKPWDLVNA